MAISTNFAFDVKTVASRLDGDARVTRSDGGFPYLSMRPPKSKQDRPMARGRGRSKLLAEADVAFVKLGRV